MLDQFDRLRRRNAFMEQYKKEKMFENGLEEFDDARYVTPEGRGMAADDTIRATCDELLREYKACESPDYIQYVSLVALHSFVILCVHIGFCRRRSWTVNETVQSCNVYS